MSGIKIGHQNFRSLRNKVPVLFNLLNDEELDILCITETWLTMNEPFPVPSGYELRRKDCQSKGGRVSIIHRKHLKIKPVTIPTDDWISPNSLEYLFFNVQMGMCPSFLLCVLYRTSHIKNDVQNLCSMFCKLSLLNKPVLFLGDLNINFACQKTHANLKRVLTRIDFTKMVGTPTRGDNILDVIITNDTGFRKCSNVTVKNCGISDHQFVRYCVKENRKRVERRLIKNYNQANWVDMIRWVADYCSSPDSMSTNSSIDIICESVNRSMSDFVPSISFGAKRPIPFVTSDKNKKN